jgi:hypothetical protein
VLSIELTSPAWSSATRILPPSGPKLIGATTGDSISPPLLACARNVTCGPPTRLSILKTSPEGHVTIMSFPNVPTLSNVIELWSPSAHGNDVNNVKGPGGVALTMNWPSVTKTSRGVNPAAAACAGAIAMYFSPPGAVWYKMGGSTQVNVLKV